MDRHPAPMACALVIFDSPQILSRIPFGLHHHDLDLQSEHGCSPWPQLYPAYYHDLHCCCTALMMASTSDCLTFIKAENILQKASYIYISRKANRYKTPNKDCVFSILP